MHTRRLLNGNEVDAICGTSRSQRHVLMNDGKFPRGFLLCGTRRRVFPSDEIDRWVSEQIAAATNRSGEVQ